MLRDRHVLGGSFGLETHDKDCRVDLRSEYGGSYVIEDVGVSDLMLAAQRVFFLCRILSPF